MTPTPPWLRAEVLRVLHKAKHGAPLVSLEQLAACGYLTKRDLRFMQLADDDDIGLVNECLLLEHELREQAFATLERLLWHAQWGESELDDRLLALPQRDLARAVLLMDALGWVEWLSPSPVFPGGLDGYVCECFFASSPDSLEVSLVGPPDCD